ncbi:MAG: carbohydrate ABC transporter permease [Oceanibaculum sp.]
MMAARENIRAGLRFVVLMAGAALMLAPFVWMVAISLKPPAEIFDPGFRLLPRDWHAVENYTRAATEVPLLRFLLNGVIVCAGILFFQIAAAVPCAYALAKFKFPGRGLVFALVLLGLMIPSHVPAIPLYIALAKLGMLDTYAALIAPSAISVFAIFLFRQFFRTLPDDLIHAARVDGMGEFAIVWRVVLPSAWPALTAFSIFSVVAHWNDLFWPMIVITDMNLATPPLGIVFFRDQESGSDYGALMAGTVIMTAPLVAAFLLAQRRFIEGITLSGLKG